MSCREVRGRAGWPVSEGVVEAAEPGAPPVGVSRVVLLSKLSAMSISPHYQFSRSRPAGVQRTPLRDGNGGRSGGLRFTTGIYRGLGRRGRLRWRARRPGLGRRAALGDASSIGVHPCFDFAPRRRYGQGGNVAQARFFREGEEIQRIILLGHDDIVAGTHALLAEVENVDRLRALLAATSRDEFLIGAIEDGAGRTDRCAHWGFAEARAVVAEVAFAHVVAARIELGYTEGAGVDTVADIDTAGAVGLMHHAVRADEDRLSGTDLGAGSYWLLTVHAERR